MKLFRMDPRDLSQAEMCSVERPGVDEMQVIPCLCANSHLVGLPLVLQHSRNQLLLQLVGPFGESPDQLLGLHLEHPQAHHLDAKAVGQKGLTLPGTELYPSGFVSTTTVTAFVCLL